MEALGYSGGIWLLWKDHLDVSIFKTHPQFIHMKISGHGMEDWFFTVVYGSSNYALRKYLCRYLNQDYLQLDEPWLIVGNFNSVISADETSNFDKLDQRRYASFVHWIFDHDLIDLGFTGPTFTGLEAIPLKHLSEHCVI